MHSSSIKKSDYKSSQSDLKFTVLKEVYKKSHSASHCIVHYTAVCYCVANQLLLNQNCHKMQTFFLYKAAI